MQGSLFSKSNPNPNHNPKAATWLAVLSLAPSTPTNGVCTPWHCGYTAEFCTTYIVGLVTMTCGIK